MIAEKTYLKPTTVEEAIQLAHEHENSFRFLAGGTDVIVNKFQDNDDAECLIDITGIEELQQVAVTPLSFGEGSGVRTKNVSCMSRAGWSGAKLSALKLW